jgi:hypothetical protein
MIEGAMPNEAYAASVVKQILKKEPPKWFWQGNRAWIIWFLNCFFPHSVWVSCIYVPFPLTYTEDIGCNFSINVWPGASQQDISCW